MDVIEFLTARLDEDQAAAEACPPWPWRFRMETDEVFAEDGIPVAEVFALSNRQMRATGEHIARWDPARVLAEVEAKRQALLTRGQGVCSCGPGDGYENPPTDPGTREPIPHHYDCAAYEAALMFVQVYADHPDFDPSWTPVTA